MEERNAHAGGGRYWLLKRAFAFTGEGKGGDDEGSRSGEGGGGACAGPTPAFLWILWSIKKKRRMKGDSQPGEKPSKKLFSTTFGKSRSRTIKYKLRGDCCGKVITNRKEGFIFSFLEKSLFNKSLPEQYPSDIPLHANARLGTSPAEEQRKGANLLLLAEERSRGGRKAGKAK